MTWWHKLALGTVPVVGVCLCLLLLQISAAVPQFVSDARGLSGEGVTAFRSVNTTVGSVNTLVQHTTTRVDGLQTADEAACADMADNGRMLALDLFKPGAQDGF